MKEKTEKSKGDALKGLACRQISFSEEKQAMMHNFCERLKLSPQIEEQAEEMYKTFLRKTLDITITPKSAICASYIAALLQGEHRKQSEFKQFNISTPTMRTWWRWVADEVGIEWEDMKANIKRRGENNLCKSV